MPSPRDIALREGVRSGGGAPPAPGALVDENVLAPEGPEDPAAELQGAHRERDYRANPVNPPDPPPPAANLRR